MLNNGWWPDIIVWCTTKNCFQLNLSCTSTLYHWIDCGIAKTKNIDLFEEITRKPRIDCLKHQ